MNKDKRTRFVEIAGARTNRIINDLRLLGNCSSKNNYEYTEADVRKMFSAIEEALRVCKSKFTQGEKTRKFTFDK